MKTDSTTEYQKAGVNVKLGDAFSGFCGKLCRTTYSNSPYVKIKDVSKGHFRGPRGVLLKGLPRGSFLVGGSDGTGTKVVLTSASRRQEDSGNDLGAMMWEDITRHGGLPLYTYNVLDTATIGKKESDPLFKAHVRLMQGFQRAAMKAGVVLLGGETAELSVCIGDPTPGVRHRYNWSGSTVGVNHKSKIITGSKIKAGDVVIALKETGFRSNGISLVRRILAKKFGKRWWRNPKARKYIHAAAEPSVLYTRFLTELNGWFSPGFKPIVKLTGIAHLSGGGIESKFGEDLIFRHGFSARLTNLWEPSDIMRRCAYWGNLKNQECYSSWNGGQGMLLVCRAKDASTVIRFAKKHGIAARRSGVVIESTGGKPSVEIISKFRKGKVRFEAKD